MRLILTSIGMISSVGRDVKSSCASARAGIMRIAEIPHTLSFDPEAQSLAGLKGCMVTPLTDGFGSVGRWNILGQQALNDLIAYGNLKREDTEFWKKTAVVFALPSMDEASFDFEGVVDIDSVMSIFVIPFIAQCNLAIPLNYCQFVSEDDTAVITACKQVEGLLALDGIDRVVVLAVDSLVEGHRLKWLDLLQRIKTEDMPVGLIPGEAAGALLFEKESAIAARNAKALARIYAHSTCIEKNAYLSEEPNSGMGLTESIRQTLSALQLTDAFVGTIYADLNGEEWRAQEYALARFNLHKSELSEQGIQEIFPAAALGDVGVVTPASSICMLIESQQRAYAYSPDALILASAAAGTVGSLLVRAY